MNSNSLRKSLRILSPHLLFAALLAIPQLTLAIEGGGGGSAQLINPLKADNIVQLIRLVFDIITALLVPVAIFFLVRTGFYFVTAGGNEETLRKAKTDFFYVIIGIALILGAQLIGAILQNTLVDLRR